MSEKSYQQVMSELQKLESFMKEQVEAFFDLTVEEFENYDYDQKRGIEAIFKGKDNNKEIKRYYLQVPPEKTDPIVRPIKDD